MYERSTRNISVAVKPAFLDDQSDPDEQRYLWSYTVTIENKGVETVQLLSRYWQITDGHGQTKEVRGPGVVGAQPVIAPGQKFQIGRSRTRASRPFSSCRAIGRSQTDMVRQKKCAVPASSARSP